MSQKLDISIIIVNYKSWVFLKKCLQSLQFKDALFSFEIIVVDNFSNDGKLDDFKLQFPNVSFVLNSGNNGFANGCNLGAKYAKGDYLFFLNPDTISNETALYKMWHFARQNPAVGITSCLQKKLDGSYEKIHRSFLKLNTLFGVFRAFAKKKKHQDSVIIYTDWVSGSVVCISRFWFNKIKGWNEDFWMYFEDVDLCKRVKEANGNVALLKDVEIIHNHGGASRINIKTSKITKTEVQISKHIYIHNHLKGFERFTAQSLQIISNLFVKFLISIISLFFFFIPKARLNVYLFIEIVKYYLASLYKKTWLSKRSINYLK